MLLLPVLEKVQVEGVEFPQRCTPSSSSLSFFFHQLPIPLSLLLLLLPPFSGSPQTKELPSTPQKALTHSTLWLHTFPLFSFVCKKKKRVHFSALIRLSFLLSFHLPSLSLTARLASGASFFRCTSKLLSCYSWLADSKIYSLPYNKKKIKYCSYLLLLRPPLPFLLPNSSFCYAPSLWVVLDLRCLFLLICSSLSGSK